MPPRFHHDQKAKFPDAWRRQWNWLGILLMLVTQFGLLNDLAIAQRVSSPSEDADIFDDAKSGNEVNQYHLSATGKPCITIGSHARAQFTNKRIYEHWISASNSCGQNINVQVCYHKTEDCIVMNVPPWESKSAVLGIYPLSNFEYDVKEK